MSVHREIFQIVNRFLRKRKAFPDSNGARRRMLSVEPLEERRLLATIDLASLGASQGSVIFGADASDYSGFSVSNACDVNGDGFDDMLIGASRAYAANNNKPNAGETYILFGSASVLTTIDLANLGSDGIRIFGVDASDRSGSSVSNAGDVNGDGFDDVIIGAFFASASGNAKSRAGDSYVVFGGASLPPTIDLASLGSAGVTIYGAETLDRSATSVNSAGDVNGDGFDDLVIGAPGADASSNAKSMAGDSYLIFGGATLPTAIDLANIGTAGVAFFGADIADESGYFVSGAGDINADGFNELIIGARFADAFNNLKSSAGDCYVIWGKADWSTTFSIDLANLGSAGVTIYGADSGDRNGFSSDSAGDVNGDGFDDLLIGAYTADGLNNNTSNAGDGYLIYGAASLPSSINLASLGSAGVTFYGVDYSDLNGVSVGSAGDVNADGFDDLIFGAFNADAAGNVKLNSGESYVVFGGPSLANAISLSSLGSAGITIYGADAGDLSGASVSGAGDVNGDGFDDLIIGAFNAGAANNSKVLAGESYLIYGGNFTTSVTHLGSEAGETLSGTVSPNVMNGARGNDTLIGNGGADVLIGGQGNDTLAISDLAFKRIAGGTGHDTLRLDGNGLSLNLTTIRDNRILDIEEIDITGNGINTLTLNQREVLNLSGFKNSLVVRRNPDDVVNIGSGWVQGNYVDIGGNLFAVYTQGQAKLKVQAYASGPTALNRQVFYNRSTSTVFGNGTGNPSAAIGVTKSPLFAGQTPSFANYTNYVKGLNGLLVDIANLPGTPTSADFQFATWNGIDLAGFAMTAAIPTFTILPGVGLAGSSRVKVEFADNAIRNTWLRVTVLANSNTGLTSNDVFYFGNAVADMNVGNSSSPVTVRANSLDTAAVRQNQSTIANSVDISSIHDLNKDGRVNALDTSIVRLNQLNSIIRFFDVPLSFLASVSDLSSAGFGQSVPMVKDVAGTVDAEPTLSDSRLNASPQSASVKLPSARARAIPEEPLLGRSSLDTQQDPERLQSSCAATSIVYGNLDDDFVQCSGRGERSVSIFRKKNGEGLW